MSNSVFWLRQFHSILFLVFLVFLVVFNLSVLLVLAFCLVVTMSSHSRFRWLSYSLFSVLLALSASVNQSGNSLLRFFSEEFFFGEGAGLMQNKVHLEAAISCVIRTFSHYCTAHGMFVDHTSDSSYWQKYSRRLCLNWLNHPLSSLAHALITDKTPTICTELWHSSLL